MKTKIIYISGAEIFDMADIRNAFDQVRATLNLGDDTVMFGVPVDANDALGNIESNVPASIVHAPTIAATVHAPEHIQTPDVPQLSQPDVTEPIITDTVSTQDISESYTEPAAVAEPDTPKPQRRTRGRPKSEPRIADDAAVTVAEPVITTDTVAPDSDIVDAPASETDDTPVIPILSVLASKDIDAENVTTPEPGADTQPDIEHIDITAAIVDSAIIEPDLAETPLADMVADDVPTAPVEKTLEVLLESMKPLSEDFIADDSFTPDADDVTDTESTAPISYTTDADETLQKLAAEFAETEDKIISTPKAENRGKIGKLKNILPFKKVKRDDGGLMGDLFGWAGIAANDEDISIPGFFTTAASKK